MSGKRTDDDSKNARTTQSTISRREALTAGAAGIGLISGIGSLRAADTVRYVKQVGRDNIAYRTVPQGWYEHEFTRVDNALADAREKYGELPGVQGLSRVRNPHRSIHGLNTSQIKIYLHDMDAIPATSINSVPIVTERAKNPTSTGSLYCDFDDSYQNIGGGVEIGSKLQGTSCCRVWDHDVQEWRILSANHIFDPDADNVGKDVEQPEGGETIGTIREQNKSEDWVLIEITSDDTVSETIRLDDPEDGNDTMPNKPLGGFVTREDVVYLESNRDKEDPIYQQGRTSGLTYGYVTEVDAHITGGSGNPADHTHGVFTSANGGGGDSGGPIMTNCSWDESEACLIALTTSARDALTESYQCDYSMFNAPTVHKNMGGVAAYHLSYTNDHHNLEFF